MSGGHFSQCKVFIAKKLFEFLGFSLEVNGVEVYGSLEGERETYESEYIFRGRSDFALTVYAASPRIFRHWLTRRKIFVYKCDK